MKIGKTINIQGHLIKSEQNGAKRTKRKPKGAQREPKTTKMERKGTKREPNGDRNAVRDNYIAFGLGFWATKMHPKIDARKREPKGSLPQMILDHFGVIFGEKNGKNAIGKSYKNRCRKS